MLRMRFYPWAAKIHAERSKVGMSGSATGANDPGESGPRNAGVSVEQEPPAAAAALESWSEPSARDA